MRLRTRAIGITLLLILIGGLFYLNQPAQASVLLLYFRASAGENSVRLEWQTAGELNVSGFNLSRSVNPQSDFIQVNQNLIPAGGDSLLGQIYGLNDTSLSSNTTYYYRLEIVRTDQTRAVYGPLQIATGSNSTAEVSLTPGITQGAATTQPAGSTPSRTPTTRATNNMTATNTLVATPVPTQTFTPTNSPTVTVTPTSTDTPTAPVQIVDTLTPVILPDFAATETAIVIALSTQIAQITPEITETPEGPQAVLSGNDWLRIGLLVLVAAVWVLLGIWLYIYLSRLNT